MGSSIAGEVKKPDVYKIKQKTSVLGSVALAGEYEIANRKQAADVVNRLAELVSAQTSEQHEKRNEEEQRSSMLT